MNGIASRRSEGGPRAGHGRGFTREMSMSTRELTRVMTRLGATPLPPGRGGEMRWRLAGADLRAAPLPPLRRGALSLPCLRVELDCSALAEDDAATLRHRLELAFWRGGG